MSGEEEKPRGPRTSAKGQRRADEKFARQAASLRANLRRRHQQRRGVDAPEEADGDGQGGNADTE